VRPIAVNGVAWSVCLFVYLPVGHVLEFAKQLNRLNCQLEGSIGWGGP